MLESRALTHASKKKTKMCKAAFLFLYFNLHAHLYIKRLLLFSQITSD